jgi:hypothetical protein
VRRPLPHDLPATAIVRLVDEGEDPNEVEGAGCTPLHNAAFEGWAEGCELLLGLGAKVTNVWGGGIWRKQKTGRRPRAV